VDISDLVIADLNCTRSGMKTLMKRGWGDKVAATERCLSCGDAKACRASCPEGVDMPG